MQSSENGTKVCGGMGYAVEGLRTSLGRGDAWIRVPERVQTDGPDFSLCAAPLESSGPGF